MRIPLEKIRIQTPCACRWDYQNVKSIMNKSTLRNMVNFELDPFNPKILLVILPTVCHTILMLFDLRIWYWINY